MCVSHTLSSRLLHINSLCSALQIRNAFGCACHADMSPRQMCASHTLSLRVTTSKSTPFCAALQIRNAFGCACHTDMSPRQKCASHTLSLPVTTSKSTPFVLLSKYATHSDVRVTQTRSYVRGVRPTHSHHESSHPNQPPLYCSPHTSSIRMCVSHRRATKSKVCVTHTTATSHHIQIKPLLYCPPDV